MNTSDTTTTEPKHHKPAPRPLQTLDISAFAPVTGGDCEFSFATLPNDKDRKGWLQMYALAAIQPRPKIQVFFMQLAAMIKSADQHSNVLKQLRLIWPNGTWYRLPQEAGIRIPQFVLNSYWFTETHRGYICYRPTNFPMEIKDWKGIEHLFSYAEVLREGKNASSVLVDLDGNKLASLVPRNSDKFELVEVHS